MTEQELMDKSIACKYCMRYDENRFGHEMSKTDLTWMADCFRYQYKGDVNLDDKCKRFALRMGDSFFRNTEEPYSKREDGTYIIELKENPSLLAKLTEEEPSPSGNIIGKKGVIVIAVAVMLVVLMTFGFSLFSIVILIICACAIYNVLKG